MQQVERGGSPWVPGSSDPATGGQLQGHPPPPMPGQPRSQQQQVGCNPDRNEINMLLNANMLI